MDPQTKHNGIRKYLQNLKGILDEIEACIPGYTRQFLVPQTLPTMEDMRIFEEKEQPHFCQKHRREIQFMKDYITEKAEYFREVSDRMDKFERRLNALASTK